MCHHRNDVVCYRHLFFGCAQKHSEVFGATKFPKNFDGMKIHLEEFSAQKIAMDNFLVLRKWELSILTIL